MAAASSAGALPATAPGAGDRVPATPAGRALPRRSLTALSLATQFAASLGIGAALALVVALLAPAAIGWRPYTVLTGSMRPALQPGDIVVNQPIPPLDARPGDVVTYPDPSRPGKLVTHRVEEVSVTGGSATVVTRGDANSRPERWQVPLDATIGRAAFKVPDIGYVAVAAGPRTRMALIMAPILLLAILQIARIWRRPDPVPGARRAHPD